MVNHRLFYHTLDLNFQGFPRNIASYAIPLESGKWILIESGPYSCHSTLTAELRKYGVDLHDIEKVFVTHIHLDHSGGAWALAQAGAQIHVHPLGAPHLIDPSKLYESASRIYGEKMETLWSKVGPIEEKKVVTADDSEVITLPGKTGKIQITAHHTTGHASHHISWQVNQVLFAGDICGVRLNEKMVEIPAPPPEFHIGEWVASLAKIHKLVEDEKVTEIALTHFGAYLDIQNLLLTTEARLQEITAWFRGQVKDKQVEEWNINPNDFQNFLRKRYLTQGMSEEEIAAMCNITPPEMTITGILRYLKKFENWV